MLTLYLLVWRTANLEETLWPRSMTLKPTVPQQYPQCESWIKTSWALRLQLGLGYVQTGINLPSKTSLKYQGVVFNRSPFYLHDVALWPIFNFVRERRPTAHSILMNRVLRPLRYSLIKQHSENCFGSKCWKSDAVKAKSFCLSWI